MMSLTISYHCKELFFYLLLLVVIIVMSMRETYITLLTIYRFLLSEIIEQLSTSTNPIVLCIINNRINALLELLLPLFVNAFIQYDIATINTISLIANERNALARNEIYDAFLA